MRGIVQSWLQKVRYKVSDALLSKTLTFAQQRGRAAERAAEAFLKKKNWRFVARNWKFHPDEIDLVFQDATALVFVEVRARHIDAWVRGFDSLSLHKRQCLRRASQAYLRGLSQKPQTWRWDFIEIDLALNGGILNLKHYQNITI